MTQEARVPTMEFQVVAQGTLHRKERLALPDRVERAGLQVVRAPWSTQHLEPLLLMHTASGVLYPHDVHAVGEIGYVHCVC